MRDDTRVFSTGSPGGEGSPQWWFVPEPRSLWGSNVVFDLHSGKSKPEPVLLPGRTEVPPVKQDDNLKAHTDNWLACMRSRKTPNGSIETGFAHSIAVIMATRGDSGPPDFNLSTSHWLRLAACADSSGPHRVHRELVFQRSLLGDPEA